MTTPARFFQLPDGRPSSIQIGPDGRTPVAVSTPQQLAEWSAIQDAAPPTLLERDTAFMAASARPLSDGSEVVSGLDDARRAAEAVADVTATQEPASKAEYDQRVTAAVQLAAALGLQLVYVPVTDELGQPPHLELRYPGNPWGAEAGTLPALETSLRNLARKRARERRLIDDAARDFARVSARVVTDEQAEAESTAGQLAAMRAEIAALRAERAAV